MEKKWVGTLMLLAVGSMASAHTVGTGGDALRDLFEQGRTSAAYQVEHLSSCSFAAGTPQATIDWIMQNQTAMADDVHHVDYRWAVDDQPTCGFTEHSSKAPIYFSYPTCAATVGTNLGLAVFTILHETAHHLGVNDEHAADQVAQAIQGADLNKTCPQPGSVFDPKVCQGPDFSTDDARRYLPAGVTQASFGSYSITARERHCTQLSGCTDWGMAQPSFDTNGNLRDLKSGPVITLTAVGSAPYYAVNLNQVAQDGFFLVAFNSNGALSAVGSTGYVTRNAFSEHLTDTVFLKSNCLWYRTQSTSFYQGAADWYESEAVVFGENTPR